MCATKRQYRGKYVVLPSEGVLRKIPLPIIVPVRIGENVKAARRQRFMTQAQLAKAAALSQRTLVNIETNRVHPHFSTILKIAEALGVEPSELVDKE
jgi:DNA-binding XRE family transcriptional regulator